MTNVNAASMRAIAWLAGLFLAVAAISARPAETPDFSGQWAADPETAPGQGAGSGPRTDVTGNMGSGWGSPITVTQDATELVVEYTPFSRYDIQPALRFHYALNGSETRTDLMIGHAPQERRSRARWQGETLEISSIYPALQSEITGDLTAEMVQRLTLVSVNELVIEVARTALGRTGLVTRTTYRRVTAR